MKSILKLNVLVSIVFSIIISDFGGNKFVLCEVAQPCSLVWKYILRGEPIPEDAVPTHGSEHFIAKLALYSSFFYYYGRVENSTGIAYFERNGLQTFVRSPMYQILTNPNDCAISWERTEAGGDMPERRFAVPYDSSRLSRGYVSRIKYGNAELGAVLRGEFCYLPTYGGVDKKIAGAAKYLKSTINLRCELNNFKFSDEEVDEGDPDFLGMDTIINDANTIVTQTVVHSKTFTESYTFTEASSFSQVETWSVSLQIPLPWVKIGIDFNYEDREANGQSETIGHTTEKEVTSTRTVVVPPYTAVQICSIVYIPNGLQMPYTARGRYYIKGKTARQVKEILDTQPIDDIENIELREDSVYADLRGSLEISIPTKTRFLITTPEDDNGCKQIHGKILELQREKKRKNVTGVLELRKKIQQMIDANIQN